MGDLKTPFDKAVYPTTSDLAGDGVTARGSDPLIDRSGTGALNTFWEPDPYPWPTGVPVPAVNTDRDGQETPNSVSGLPLLPSRFEPNESPVDQPTLERRNPGTIDKS